MENKTMITSSQEVKLAITPDDVLRLAGVSVDQAAAIGVKATASLAMAKLHTDAADLAATRGQNAAADALTQKANASVANALIQTAGDTLNAELRAMRKALADEGSVR